MRQPTLEQLAAAALALGLFAAPAWAQYREYYIQGKVLDQHKAPIAAAEVRLVDNSTSRSYRTRTDANGVYKLAGLPHAVYKVTISHDGYLPFEDEWKFESPQTQMKKVELNDVVLASQTEAQHAAQLKDAEAGVKKASEKIRVGDFDGAIALLDPVLAKNPKDANALFYLGLSRAGKQQHKEAVESLTRVTELQPDFPGAWLQLGICYGKLGETGKALDAYDKDLKLQPGDAPALYNSGLLLFEANRVDEALARFEQGIAAKPQDPDLHDMAARCYIHEGKLDRALEHLQNARAATTDPARSAQLDALIEKVKAQIK
jgi:tetratricopeptide (TPR) repeat protein